MSLKTMAIIDGDTVKVFKTTQPFLYPQAQIIDDDIAIDDFAFCKLDGDRVVVDEVARLAHLQNKELRRLEKSREKKKLKDAIEIAHALLKKEKGDTSEIDRLKVE